MIELLLINCGVCGCVVLLLNFMHSLICRRFVNKFKAQTFKDYVLSFKNIYHAPIVMQVLKVLLEVIFAFSFSIAISFMALLLAINSTSFILLSAFGVVIFFIISFIKFKVLKEPLIWTDFALVHEMFMCPGFYFKYVPKVYYLLACFFLAAFVGLSLLFDIYMVDITFEVRIFALFGFAVSLGIFSGILFLSYKLIGLNKRDTTSLWLPFSYDNAIDGAVYSPLVVFVVTFFEVTISHKKLESFLKDYQHSFYENLNKAILNPTDKVLLVQAESLVDLHRVIGNYDYSGGGFAALTKKTSVNLDFKTADIGYFGAYTMRSEFSALTGITLKDLGPFSYDPYLAAKKYKMPSIAQVFKNLGYQTICIHPNSKKFFARDIVMKNMGFEVFFDDEGLLGKENLNNINNTNSTTSIPRKKAGDDDLVKKVIELLTLNNRCFIFAITIDTHGPYGKLQEQVSNYSKKADKALHNLITILKTIKSSNEEIGMLLYGDHLPPIDEILNKAKNIDELKPEFIATKNMQISLQDKESIALADIYKLLLRVKEEKDKS